MAWSVQARRAAAAARRRKSKAQGGLKGNVVKDVGGKGTKNYKRTFNKNRITDTSRVKTGKRRVFRKKKK